MKRVFFALILFLCVHQSVMAIDLSDYRRDVDLYRTSYAAYEVKKGAFTLNRTFAAEEELITAARAMLLTRADVWVAYWELLGTRITTLTQMPKESQDTIVENLTTEVKMIQTHKERLMTAKTRAELLIEAGTLDAQLEKYRSLAFSINSELATNKMLQASQLLLSFNQNLIDRTKQQQLEEAEKTSKLRGLTVDAERIDQIIAKLFSIRATLIENVGYASAESFSKITQLIGPLYPELSQQFQTTVELSKGVEW